MHKSIKEQVTSITGISFPSSTISNDDVDVFANHAIIDIISKLKYLNPTGYLSFATRNSVPSNGAAKIDGDVIGVFGSEVTEGAVITRRPATEIDFNLSSMATDPGSIHYQSKFSPAYYRVGREVFVIPEGGEVLSIYTPEINADDTDIYSVPMQYIRSIVLGAAIRVLEKDVLTDARFTSDSYSFSDDIKQPSVLSFAAALPELPERPIFAHTSTELQEIYEGTELEVTNVRANFPVFVPAALTTIALSSELGQLDLPEPPVPPSETSISINFTDTPPLYEMPPQEEIDFPAITDFQLDAGTVLPGDPPQPAFAQDGVGSIDIGLLGTPPIYIPPKLLGIVEELMENSPGSTVVPAEGDIQNVEALLGAAWSYIVEEEDPELAGSVNSFIGTISSLYGTAMSNAQNELSAKTQEYQQNVNKVMQQAQIDQATAAKNSDIEWQVQLQQFQQELATYGAKLNRYSADVQTQVQEWTLQNLTYEMEAWNRKQANKFAKFQHAMTNELNMYNSSMAKYNAEFTRSVKDAELLSADQIAKFSRYDKDLQAYTATVNSRVQEFQQNELSTKFEEYKFERQQTFQEYQADNANQLNAFNESVQKMQTELTIAQANAQSVQNALTQKMAMATELEKHNSLQTTAQELSTFQSQMNHYSTAVATYSAEINTQNTEFSASINKANVNMNDAMNTFTTKLQQFQHEMQYKEKILAGLRMDYVQSLGVQQKQGE